MKKRKIGLVVNGRHAGHAGLHQAVEDVRAAGHEVVVRVTWEGGDAERYAAEVARAGADVVAAAGGDGTLHEVVNGVLAGGEAACAVGVIPLGTANDFAAAWGLAGTDPLTALYHITEGAPRPIDVGRIDGDVGRDGGRWFINVASGGFGAEVTAQTPPERKHLLGRAAYLLTGLAHVKNIQALPVRLTAPDLTWEGALYALAVGNGRQAGGGFRVCPRARLDDGLLDVLVVPDLPPLDLFRLLDGLLRRPGAAPGDQEPVVYRQVPSLTVEAEAALQINLDGEPLRGRAFRFGIRPGALPFILPAGADLR